MQALDDIRRQFKELADANNWHPKHTAKNLSMAIAVEAAELMEIFQWLTDEQTKTLDTDQRRDAAFEMADVFIYLLCLADKLEVDLFEVSREKMRINRQRFGKV